MKVTGFYEDGQRIVELLEGDKKKYTEWAADKRYCDVSRETYKFVAEYVGWLLEWITVREEGEK